MLAAKKVNSKQKWEDFILNHPQGSFLQSWNWGEFHKKIDNKIFRIGYYKDNKLDGVSLLIKEEAKRGNYLQCPAGPLFKTNFKNNFEHFVNEIKKLGKKERVNFVRVRPQLIESKANKKLFKNNGFISAPMHLHAENTWQLKLDRKAKVLLNNMRKSRRYEIRKAKRDGVKIVKSIDPNDIDLLYKLQLKTAKRQDFVPFPCSFMKEQFKVFVKDNQAKLYKAIYKDKLLAISMFIFYNQEAVYHYSATANIMRSVPSAQRILWEAILEAKERDFNFFNFWGIAPKDREKNHRFSGVTFFKKGFGGKRVDYLHAQDLPINFLYWPTYAFESFRKWKRGL